jgi:hypothetical protein
VLITPINTYLTPINTLHISQIGQKNGTRIMATIGKLLGNRVKLCLPVFTPPLNTLWRRDPNKNIPDSIENGEGVKVISRGGDKFSGRELPGRKTLGRFPNF